MAYVQHVLLTSVSAGAGTASGAITGVAAGNSLAVAVVQYSAATNRVYSATTSNFSGSADFSSVRQYLPGRGAAVLVKHNVLAGSHTITVNADAGTTPMHVWVFEFSEYDGTGATVSAELLEAAATLSHTSAPAGEIDTAQASFVLVAGALSSTVTTSVAGATYEKATAAPNSNAFCQYKDAASALTDDAGAWTTTGTARIATSIMVAFPQGAGAGPPSSTGGISIAWFGH
jgi:hypothetical protein